MLVSVVIPAYNEEGNVRRAIAATRAILQEMEVSWELIVADDGSSDRTAAIVEEASADPRVRLLSHPANFGVGAALRTGFKGARGWAVVTLDADLSYSPLLIPRMLSELRRAHIAVVSPYRRGGGVLGVRAYRLLLSRAANLLLSAFTPGLTCVTSLARAYRSSVLRSIKLESRGKEINFEVLAKARRMGYVIREIPGVLVGRRRRGVGAREFIGYITLLWSLLVG